MVAPRPRILADANIPCVHEAFASLAEVETCSGRAITPALLGDKDILLVRSVTRVDADLLAGSPVRFVGSATSGTDHIDRDGLAARGIVFADAHGSNARSVAEYVVVCLLELCRRRGRRLAGMCAGVIGHGAVGRRLVAMLQGLGVSCLVNDPPLEDAGEAYPFVDLAELRRADIISLHVPLEDTGPHQTRGLIDAAFIRAMKPGAILVNTARGAVVDEAALLAALASGQDLSVVLDCWAGEPAIDRALLRQVAIATPHIAGYSLDGKLRATAMLHEAVARFLRRPHSWRPASVPPVAPAPPRPPAGASMEMRLLELLRSRYDVRRDDEALRRIQTLDPEAAAREFDRLRRDYPVRREFPAAPLDLDGVTGALRERLRVLGWVVGPRCGGREGG